jgi:hypothetical protein
MTTGRINQVAPSESVAVPRLEGQGDVIPFVHVAETTLCAEGRWVRGGTTAHVLFHGSRDASRPGRRRSATVVAGYLSAAHILDVASSPQKSKYPGIASPTTHGCAA